MTYMLLMFLTGFQEPSKAVFMVEETVLQLPGSAQETTQRHLYISKDSSHRVRVDFPGTPITFLYDLDLKTFIVVDKENKTYYLNRPGHDKNILRSPLMGITINNAATIAPKKPVVIATGKERTISEAQCKEYKLNLPDNFGMSMSIWATPTRFMDDPKNARTIWFAALGSEPPWDVKGVLTKLTNEIKGQPTQVITHINQEGVNITLTTTLVKIDRHYEIPKRFFEIPNNFEIVQNADDDNRPWQN